MAKGIGLPDTPIAVVQMLADVSLWALRELSKEPRFSMTKGPVIPNTFTHEFVEWIGFMFNNRTEVAQKVRSYHLGYIEDPANLVECLEFALTEQILKALLVTIAKVNTSEMQLPNPEKALLGVRETKKVKSNG